MRGIIVIALLLGACGKKEDAKPAAADGCAKDSDCKGDRVCNAGACVDPAAKGTGTAAPPTTTTTPPTTTTTTTPPTTTTTITTTTTPAAGGCAAAAANWVQVLSTTGTASDKAYVQAHPVADVTAQCEQRPWDPAVMACVQQAANLDAIHACYAAAFPGPVDATPRRTLDARADNSGAQPPPLTQDADYLEFWPADANGGGCGFLFREKPPAFGMFVVCNGRVELGPFTREDQITEVIAVLRAQESDRSNIVNSILARMHAHQWGTPTHVYGADGSYKGFEYR